LHLEGERQSERGGLLNTKEAQETQKADVFGLAWMLICAQSETTTERTRHCNGHQSPRRRQHERAQMEEREPAF
jgi:hypothetical protein